MADALLLPPGAALGIIAFLLSLLPAGMFIWLWYLRRKDRAVPAMSIAMAFVAGLLLVIPAFQFEDLSERFWYIISPATVHYFTGAVLPLQGLKDIFFPAVGTFILVATIEEGLRYLVLYYWIRRSKVIDQVFDGLLVGVATGLGFATLENTIYFLGLFKDANYDTLVFVFFLRFLISTLAHVSFGGLMGALIARGVFNLYDPKKYLLPAFFIPWFLHGLYDLLLGINQGFYAVFLLLPALFVVIKWSSRREFFVVNRKNGQLLAVQEGSTDTKTNEVVPLKNKQQDSPWNMHSEEKESTTGQSRRFMQSLKKYEP